MKRIEADELSVHAQGRWAEIIGHFAPDLSAPINTAGRSKHHDCPFPERHSRSGGQKKFRFYARNGQWNGAAICTCGAWGSGYRFLMDYMGWSFPQALQEINQFLGDPCGVGESTTFNGGGDAYRKKRLEEANRRKKKAAKTLAVIDKKAAARLHRVWGESVPSASQEARPVRTYLARRGINPRLLDQMEDVIRFHPSLPYYDENGKKVGDYPAMLSLFQAPDGTAVSFHRIYLTSVGEKVGASAKKLMPYPSYLTTRGGAIRLGSPTKILGVAEGIETALSVTTATKLTCWACYNDSLMSAIDVHALKAEGVKLILIWEDKDRSRAGELAGRRLQKRAWEAGIMCQRMIVPLPIPETAKGIDWNDVLQIQGASGFPHIDIASIVEEQSRNASKLNRA